MTDFTPTTKRLLIASIGLMGLTISLGWVTGQIDAKDALLPINSILIGFFALLKGIE